MVHVVFLLVRVFDGALSTHRLVKSSTICAESGVPLSFVVVVGRALLPVFLSGHLNGNGTSIDDGQECPSYLRKPSDDATLVREFSVGSILKTTQRFCKLSLHESHHFGILFIYVVVLFPVRSQVVELIRFEIVRVDP